MYTDSSFCAAGTLGRIFNSARSLLRVPSSIRSSLSAMSNLALSSEARPRARDSCSSAERAPTAPRAECRAFSSTVHGFTYGILSCLV